MKYYPFLIAALFFLDCSNTKTFENTNKTKIISADYFEVSKAIVKCLTNEGWEIQNADENDGLIKTAFRQVWSYCNGNHWLRLSIRLQSLSKNQTRVHISVFTIISPNIRSAYQVIGEQRANKSESDKYYKLLFENLGNYIKYSSFNY